MTATTRDVVRGFYESYNEHDLEKSWETYISHRSGQPRLRWGVRPEAWLGVEQGYLSAFPDLRVEVLDQVAEGDKVATRVEMTGDPEAEAFFGVPAAGAVGTLRVSFFDRVDGKIVEHWADADVGGLLQQLTGAAATL
jgi:predicted ester cyclase